MAKLNVTARSSANAETKDLAGTANIPTFEEAQKNPALVKPLNYLSRQLGVIIAQRVMRDEASKHKLGTPECGAAVQKALDGIDWEHAGSRTRGALGSKKEQLALGEILASGDMAKVQQAVALGKGTDRAAYEKFMRENAPSTFAKAAPKAAKAADAKK